MFVIARSGQKEPVRYDKITDRNFELAEDLKRVDPAKLSQKVIGELKDGMTTAAIDTLSAETAFYMSAHEPQYDILAARIEVRNLHKSTLPSFVETLETVSDIIDPDLLKWIKDNREDLESAIDYSRDFSYSYFGLKTLLKGYLMTKNKRVVERPQHMWMRVACCIHLGDVKAAIETYNLLSQGYFTHASPTLFNSGYKYPQLSSCFLLKMEDDLKHIYTTNLRSALISKHGGGIGIDITSVRCKGSRIGTTNGVSDGIVPMIQTFNATARYCNQSGKRKGSIAMYIQPWHGDIFDFLKLRSPSPPEELRARDIFLGLWIPDIFMERVESDGMWSLFCPKQIPALLSTCGDEFEKIFKEAEDQKLYLRQVPARDVWSAIIQSQQETGMPYMLYKDSVNKKSNQKNIGLINSSNLCAEVVEYTEGDSIAVCNLASICLPKFFNGSGDFDWKKLQEVVAVAVSNLNKIIDQGFSPLDEAKSNNLAYRPIGVGVQGLADCLAILKAPWASEKAAAFNRCVHEVIYYAAVKRSAELARSHGSYSRFDGSPASEGLLQYRMWNEKPWTAEEVSVDGFVAPKLDWQWLENFAKGGMRNSLLIALMPTATTAQILGNNESIEPFTSNIYARSTMAGNFIMVNKHLYSELESRGLWNESLTDAIIRNNGSIQTLNLPQDVKDVYKTAWEIPQRVIIDMAASRGPFVCQTQSMNIFMADPSYNKLSSMHMYGWRKGLKTGQYYLRSKPATNAVKFTVKCTDEICTMCSS